MKNRRRKLVDKFTSDGRRACRWCEKPVAPPRRTFCSTECVHEHKIRSNSTYARKFVYKRDLGICSLCKTDTRILRIVLEDSEKEILENSSIDILQDPKYREICKMFNMTPKESKRSLWEADHTVEVQNGGGECGINNLQTLCIKCHKEKSRANRKKKSVA